MRDSARASASEIKGQKSQDCVTDPGGMGSPRAQPWSDDRGPCENQSAGESLSGGGAALVEQRVEVGG